MRSLSLLLTPLLLAIPTTSLTLLLPLYLYPGPNATAWSAITTTITSHPSTTFQVIINPNSGPGPTTGTSPVDENQIEGIALLKSSPNVHTIGYVETEHKSRSISDVNSDVDVYASWSSYKGADISISGIYFDDVSNDDSSGTYSYYSSISSHARSSIKTSKPTQIVFNPGYRAPTQLFEYADTIVEFEDSYANYQSEGILAQIPQGVRAKSALQIYETPEGADVEGLMGTMKEAGIEAVYFGEDCCYKVWNQGLLEAMAGAA